MHVCPTLRLSLPREGQFDDLSLGPYQLPDKACICISSSGVLRIRIDTWQNSALLPRLTVTQWLDTLCIRSEMRGCLTVREFLEDPSIISLDLPVPHATKSYIDFRE